MALFPFGVRQVRVASLLTDPVGGTTGPTYNTAIVFRGVQEMSFTIDQGNQVDLPGDDIILASSAQAGALRYTLRGGGIPWTGITMMFDAVSIASGTAPNDTLELAEKPTAAPPFHQIRAVAIAPDGGDVLIELPKAKVQGTFPPLGLVNGAFTTTEITGTGYPTDSIYAPTGANAITKRIRVFQRNGTAAVGTAA